MDAKAVGDAIIDVSAARLQRQPVRLVDTDPAGALPGGNAQSTNGLVVPAGLSVVMGTAARISRRTACATFPGCDVDRIG